MGRFVSGIYCKLPPVASLPHYKPLLSGYKPNMSKLNLIYYDVLWLKTPANAKYIILISKAIALFQL